MDGSSNPGYDVYRRDPIDLVWRNQGELESPAPNIEKIHRPMENMPND